MIDPVRLRARGPRVDPALLALLGALACADPSAGDGDDAATQTTTETGADLTQALRIARVDLWQGPPARIASAAGPLEHSSPLVAGRNGLLWIEVAADETWPDGPVTTRAQLWHAGALAWSGELTNDLDPEGAGAYTYPIPAAALTEDSALVIELETDAQAVLVWPQAGPLSLPLHRTRLGLTLQPLHWNIDGCDTTPDLSAERLALYTGRFVRLLPIEGVDVEVLEPIEWTEPVDSLVPVVEALQARRVELEVAPGRLFLGLLDPCAEQLGGAGGLARDVVDDASPQAAPLRVAAIIARDPELTADRLVHESGHLLGRKHVGCAGEPDPDPDYPYSGAVLPHAYYDVDSEQFIPESLNEVMSYCRPYGTSDYGWERFSDMLVALDGLD